MDTPKKRKVLCISDKINIIQEIESGKTNSLICKQFNLSTSTVSTIWKNRKSIYKAFEENHVHLKKNEHVKDQNSMNAFLNGLR